MKKFIHILLHGWYDDDFMRGLWHSGCFTSILMVIIGIVLCIYFNVTDSVFW